VLITFSAIHTFLVDEYGKPMETHLSEWIVAHPKEFQDALQRTYTSGYSIAPTGTQASSPFRASPYGKAIVDRIYELNYKSAKLAREITPEGCYVTGVISSSNPDFLEPVGSYTYDQVYEGYLEQIRGLVDGEVDVITVVGNHIEESVIAIKAIEDNFPNMPVIGSNVFYAGKRGFRTMTGLDPETASARLQKTGAEVIGFHCGLMTKSENCLDWYPAATALLKEIKQATDRYLLIAPDAGLPQLIDGRTIYPASPKEMASEVLNWVDAGARLIGGCCGTSLEHGRMSAAVIRERKIKET
jgi:5-methyltetrahydrofolate--homocysteine methyltransferase